MAGRNNPDIARGRRRARVPPRRTFAPRKTPFSRPSSSTRSTASRRTNSRSTAASRRSPSSACCPISATSSPSISRFRSGTGAAFAASCIRPRRGSARPQVSLTQAQRQVMITSIRCTTRRGVEDVRREPAARRRSRRRKPAADAAALPGRRIDGARGRRRAEYAGAVAQRGRRCAGAVSGVAGGAPDADGPFLNRARLTP